MRNREPEWECGMRARRRRRQQAALPSVAFLVLVLVRQRLWKRLARGIPRVRRIVSSSELVTAAREHEGAPLVLGHVLIQRFQVGILARGRGLEELLAKDLRQGVRALRAPEE